MRQNLFYPILFLFFASLAHTSTITKNQEIVSQRVGFLSSAAPLFLALQQWNVIKNENLPTAIDAVDTTALLYGQLDWRKLGVQAIPALGPRLSEIAKSLHPNLRKGETFSKLSKASAIQDHLNALNKDIFEEVSNPQDVFPNSNAYAEGKMLGLSYTLQSLSQIIGDILGNYINVQTTDRQLIDSTLEAVKIFRGAFASSTDPTVIALVVKMDEVTANLENLSVKETGWRNGFSKLKKAFSKSQPQDDQEKDVALKTVAQLTKDIKAIHERLPHNIMNQVQNIQYQKTVLILDREIRKIESVAHSFGLVTDELDGEAEYADKRKQILDLKIMLKQQTNKLGEWKQLLQAAPPESSNSSVLHSLVLEIAKSQFSRSPIERLINQPDLIKTKKEFVDVISVRGSKYADEVAQAISNSENTIQRLHQAIQCRQFYSR